ncbi:protein GVQW3-like [Anas acuta]|uniref:protein GVQW3-like n=1 Tax=Anas acuta TaxID=28680 RepID=UPI0035C898BB
MEHLLEQRYAIKFSVKLGKTGKETHDMIKEAYGDAAMGRLGVFDWHKLFQEGRERVEDDDRSGRPLTSKTKETVSRVKNLLSRDRRMSIRMIADDLSIPQTQVFKMVKENLAMRKEESVRKVCAVSVVRGAKGQPESDLPGSSSSCE